MIEEEQFKWNKKLEKLLFLPEGEFLFHKGEG